MADPRRNKPERALYAGQIEQVRLVMGVSRAEAEHALAESHWDTDAAMDWLRRRTPMRGAS